MYTRTKALFNEFAKAVGLADSVIFLPIYAAREDNESGVTSRELSVKSLEFTPNSQYADSFEMAENILRQSMNEEDVILVMGAGDVTKLADALVG